MPKQLEYINKHYDLSLKKDQDVKFDGKPGTITGVRGQYVLVQLEGEQHSGAYHPTWRMEYETNN